jgi:hypothetical protein
MKIDAKNKLEYSLYVTLGFVTIILGFVILGALCGLFGAAAYVTFHFLT